MRLEILYEDNHLIAVTKPVNIPVQEDSSKDKDMLTMVKEYIKSKYNKPGNVFLGLIHRLDRPVGGAIVFAKTSKGASRLSNEIRKNNFFREYLSIVEGTINHNETLTDYLLKDRQTNMSKVVSQRTKNAKKAILNYKMLQQENNKSLLHIFLETGRSHQIRVQFSHQNTPIFGDQRYNKNSKTGQQIALWSYHLKFKHPTQDKTITITSHPPKTFPWSLFNEGVY